MNDTPDHIKALQLKIWLSKTPEERLRQMMKDNEALFKFWSKADKSDANNEILKKMEHYPVIRDLGVTQRTDVRKRHLR